jgi:hypothetical protein
VGRDVKREYEIKSFAPLMAGYGNPVRIAYKENLWLWRRRNAKQKQAATRFKYKYDYSAPSGRSFKWFLSNSQPSRNITAHTTPFHKSQAQAQAQYTYRHAGFQSSL